MEYRCEEKYLCSPAMITILRHRLTPLMKSDAHQGERPAYEIRSLYFDDGKDTGYEDTMAGLNQRKKFRLRIYNGDTSLIRLEIKSKRNGFVRKEGCTLTREQCRKLMQGQLLPFHSEDPQPLRMLNTEMRTRLLRPRIIVIYQRCAFVQREGNVRITFDENLGYHPLPIRFLDAHLPTLPAAEEYRHLLEVKYDQFLPNSLADAVQLDRLRRTAFSKYAICREANILA